MSSDKLSLIPKLEKLKAGLGAAGMAAVAFEAVGPSLFGGIFGTFLPVAAALASGIAAGYFTEVSEKEAEMESAVSKERTMTNAINQ
jgi:hypothetical protein